jgi:hypothetical protein
MQIVSSTLQLNSAHQKSEQTIENERLRLWIDNPGNPPRQPAPQGAARFIHDQPNISQAAQATQPVKKSGNLTDEPLTPTIETKFNALIQLVEQLTGKRIKIFNPAELQQKAEDVETPQQPPRNEGGAAPARAGFGVEYDYYSARIEEERSRFSATGVVKTADGKEINIELDLTMSRRFMEEQSISIRAGDAVQKVKDPLVLNFNGNAAELSETKFSFDLDSDGREEQVALLSSNSGFLTLDKNSDGVINDGGELFGAQSGNGFADLAAYDEDSNQWIDENDDIYSRLRIWSPDGSGADQLIALGQKGVGALYLGNIATPFDLKDGDNQLQGQIASSGLYLNEDGSAGTMQQVNLVV